MTRTPRVGAGIHGGHGLGPQVAEGAGGGADAEDHAGAALMLGQGEEGAAQGAGQDGQGGQGLLLGKALPGQAEGGDQVAGPEAGLAVKGLDHAPQVAGLDLQEAAQFFGAQKVHHLVQGFLKFSFIVL